MNNTIKTSVKRLFILIKQSLCPVIITTVTLTPAWAVEFNTGMIDAEDKANVDLSQFEKKGFIPIGKYIASVEINKRKLPNAWSFEWIEADNESGSQVCLTKDDLTAFGFADEFIQQLRPINPQGCLDIASKPELVVRLNKAEMVVTITAPQAWMKYQATNWTPPEFWDDGIAGFILDYNIYASQYDPNDGDKSQDISSYGTLGFNLGAWRLRSDYQYDKSYEDGHSTGSNSSMDRTYLFRPIPSISSKLTLGQYDLNSDLYDTFHFTGASLESDDNMLPPDLQGYAPQITGIAQTNAKVTVTQNGRMVYQTTVAPGPFNITDIGDTFQGQLDVTVEEEDGRKSTFQVGASSIPFLTRKGQVRYKASTGKPTSVGQTDVNNPMFWTGEFSWGWTGDTSLYGGALLTADDYQAATAGVGFNLNSFGSLSFDVTRAEATLRGENNENNKKQRGYSYRVNYAKRFEATGSQVTFAGYRFSDKEYVTMSEYLTARSGDDSQNNEKENYVISFNQYIESLAVNAYLNLTRNTYWDDSASTNYTVSVSRNFDIGSLKGISSSLSIGRSTWDDREETQYYLSFTIPLEQSRSISWYMQKNGSDSMSQTLSYYDSSDRNNTWNISASGDESDFRKAEPAIRGSYQHYSPYGRLSVNGSVQPNAYNSFTAGWNGSFTATRYGMALHDNSNGNDARMMVDADGIAGVPLSDRRTVTNMMGVAVTNSVSDYTTSTVRVDSDKLPDGVDITNSVISATLTEGAIGYAKLNATKGYQILGVVRLADGRYPPLGVTVVDIASGKDVGLVAEDGYAYLSGLQEDSTLRLQWGNNVCELTPPNQSNADGKAIILPCKTVN
ncbi:fimbrial biogenesis outer membrane usher protein [Salmonella enterica subsp. salamae]|uniref:Fimbrial biogenesis outer membrane usher protein n=1 Tax=Salmonella enterica subsp. salamae TaxID=59202 RepID=A0A5Y3V8D8_SALER|nr:fimbrial biogenesis outer membrane usher protein [Salmonella enterica subsp. salamae]EEO2383526.1 fimbrial biogenesis outer membrane usher protein [Salmonella enterica]HCM2001406.1 fimbrial biogenesis outer membrane usher protein [Salmonella enterica subsp. salamae serovar [1],40:z35:e,n,x,z15]ECG8517570.1 fimbrial biogenesis outer membrane usher protein [Salmonella enterica subsp. salamae]ECI3454707.1 fimbrial biogenesis outer membrane usher protein [Salmonella enterica subsp. salamae]